MPRLGTAAKHQQACQKPPSKQPRNAALLFRSWLTSGSVDKTDLSMVAAATVTGLLGAAAWGAYSYANSNTDQTAPTSDTAGLKSILKSTPYSPPSEFDTTRDTMPSDSTARHDGWSYRSMLPSLKTAAVAAGGLGAAYYAYQNPDMVSGAISTAGETASRYASTLKDASMSGLSTVSSFVPSAETFGSAATTARDSLYSAGSSAWSQASDFTSGVASSAAPYVESARSYLPSSDALPSLSGVMSSVANTARVAGPLLTLGKTVSSMWT